jgi:hypothetical protein
MSTFPRLLIFLAACGVDKRGIQNEEIALRQAAKCKRAPLRALLSGRISGDSRTFSLRSEIARGGACRDERNEANSSVSVGEKGGAQKLGVLCGV